MQCPPAIWQKGIIMHYLHKILVHVPSAIQMNDDTTYEEVLAAVKSHAQTQTEDYYQQAYDWREDESAGRWAEEYPDQVYLAIDNVGWFLKELEEIPNFQKAELDFAFEQLATTVGTNLKDIIDGLWGRDSGEITLKSENGFSSMTAFYLRNIAGILYGTYRCDSYFFNTYNHTARLYKSDLEEINRNPQDWALVMFDCHY